VAVLAAAVAVLAIVASFFVPEVRRRLGLEKPGPVQNQTQSDVRDQKPPKEQAKTETPVTSIPITTPKPRTKEVARSAKPNTAADSPVKGTNNNVSSLTQGPGSIAQIGGTGNRATVYNGPPEAKLSVQYGMRELQGTGAFETTISITTDRVTPGPQLTIVCDSPCAFQSMDLGVYASMGTNRQVDDKTVEVGLSQQFNPNQTLKIVLRATTQFHIVSITKM
jgi:hypothetical protein